jgi:hypothetical protein
MSDRTIPSESSEVPNEKIQMLTNRFHSAAQKPQARNIPAHVAHKPSFMRQTALQKYPEYI